VTCETFLDGRVTLHCGDSRDVLRTMADASVHSVVCDPPYALVSISKRFGKPGAAPAAHGSDGLYARASAGFMGQAWDTGETAFAADFWRDVLRVLKPGGHVAAFSGTRTYHRMAVAIEDAGFEIRDQLAWMYGSGFPKSHSLHNEWEGWGTALKPAWEPICLGRKPLVGTVAANALQWGTGAINVDGCRVEGEPRPVLEPTMRSGAVFGAGLEGSRRTGEMQSTGRWPANIVHDGSDEVVAAFPVTGPASGRPRNNAEFKSVAKGRESPHTTFGHSDMGGSAARFFYTAKADADDRIGSSHPTVKPVDLMQWLVRLVTPPGGLVLDPFSGTGTTGEAAFREGFQAVLIEREPTYCADIRRRMSLCLAGRSERRRASVAAKGKSKPLDLGPLFHPEEAAE